MKILVNLEFSDGDFNFGFDCINIQVKTTPKWSNFKRLTITLPPAPEIPSTYEKWKQVYDWLTSPATRGGFKKTQTNFSPSECDKLAQNLHQEFIQWLSPIQLQLNSVFKLNPDSEIHLFINTKKIISEATKDIVHKLPWHELDYFLKTNSLEAAICFNELKSSSLTPQTEEKYIRRARIISIFGDSRDINTKADKAILNKLKQRGGELIVLQQPQRPELVKLWDEPCDILFYGGHSNTENYQSGVIYINQDDYLDLQEIRKTLRASVNKGLKLAIFNSCDGLGLARQLADLNLPYVIVWREPVPDKIAQKFLEYFLNSFTEGKSLFKSVREARDKLQELTKNADIEKQMPGVSWLPIICQNIIDAPPTWKEMGGLTGKLPNCPYKGLSAFREEDADFFFGRDEFVEKLLKAVNTKSLVPIVGASGSGKSSVVFAGLVPQLRKNDNVQIVSFRPGDNPFDALAVALKQFAVSSTNSSQENADKERLEELELEIDLRHDKKALHEFIKKIVTPTSTIDNNNSCCVLIADQFEELYTLTPPEQRQSFLDILLYAIKFTPLFTLVLTMRADFYGKAITYRPFSDALQEGLYNLAPMNFDELESAISGAKRLRRNAKPAQAMKVDLEEGLTSRLIKDVANQPGLLPLLQFALTQLWEKQKNWFLIHQAYEEIGGIEKALANHADAVFHKLSTADKKRVERIFIQLVRLGEGVEDTRRVATRAEVGEDNWDLVDYLAGEKARLLVTGISEVTGEETVEIVHEALIGNWLLLREWVAKSREELKLKQRIEDAAVEWERRKKTNLILGKSYLLNGKFLEEAKNFHKQNSRSIFLSDLAIEFILESIEQKRDTQIKNIGCGFILPILIFIFILSTMISKETKFRYFYGDAYFRVNETRQFYNFFPIKNFARFIKLSISLKRIPGKDFDFRNGNFGNTDFSYTNLKDADFRYAKLKDSNFRYTILRNSELSGADLRNADLRNTDLANADLKNADLSGADLRNADLSGVDLRNVKINAETKLDAKWYLVWEIVNQGAFERNLSGANLTYANLKNTDLRNANLRNAELSGADFSGANLSGTNFSGSDLNCYQLKEIMEIGNILSEGRCTNFTKTTNLTPEQVKSAKNWEKAKYDKEFRIKLGLITEKEE